MNFLFLVWLCLNTTLAFSAEPHTISVRGEGELKAAPDVANLALEVQAKGKEAKSAQAKNAEGLARTLKILKKDFSLGSEDIQITQVSVNPDYRYGANGKQTFLGFVASVSLKVRVKKLDLLGSMLDSLTRGDEKASTTTRGVSFDSDKRRELETECLGRAMKSAQGRAEALARFAKKNLKGVLRIADSNVQFEPYQAAVPRVQAADFSAKAGGPTELSPGEISITASVAVEYEMD